MRRAWGPLCPLSRLLFLRPLPLPPPGGGGRGDLRGRRQGQATPGARSAAPCPSAVEEGWGCSPFLFVLPSSPPPPPPPPPAPPPASPGRGLTCGAGELSPLPLSPLLSSPPSLPPPPRGLPAAGRVGNVIHSVGRCASPSFRERPRRQTYVFTATWAARQCADKSTSGIFGVNGVSLLQIMDLYFTPHSTRNLSFLLLLGSRRKPGNTRCLSVAGSQFCRRACAVTGARNICATLRLNRESRGRHRDVSQGAATR